mmetsp:Transcript_28112/g.71276  ORF Transcript_28112/g.71276 Transcript_28112/m.71276 type:complete len:236 (-) Transcript_28112:1201-1908(-)
MSVSTWLRCCLHQERFSRGVLQEEADGGEEEDHSFSRGVEADLITCDVSIWSPSLSLIFSQMSSICCNDELGVHVSAPLGASQWLRFFAFSASPIAPPSLSSRMLPAVVEDSIAALTLRARPSPFTFPPAKLPLLSSPLPPLQLPPPKELELELELDEPEPQPLPLLFSRSSTSTSAQKRARLLCRLPNTSSSPSSSSTVASFPTHASRSCRSPSVSDIPWTKVRSSVSSRASSS